MLLDMYLFFCLPLPSPKRRAASGDVGTRKGAKGRAGAGSRQGTKAGKQRASTRRTGSTRGRGALRVIEGGRAQPR